MNKHVTVNLIWVVFLYFSPLILSSLNANPYHLTASVILIGAYCVFLSYRLEAKSKTNQQANRLRLWLTNDHNVKQLMTGCIEKLKNRLYTISPFIVLTALIMTLSDLLTVIELSHAIKTIFTLTWGFVLIETSINTYRASCKK